jgi:hypothetical protein
VLITLVHAFLGSRLEIPTSLMNQAWIRLIRVEPKKDVAAG